jgi:hypothetical protein
VRTSVEQVVGGEDRHLGLPEQQLGVLVLAEAPQEQGGRILPSQPLVVGLGVPAVLGGVGRRELGHQHDPVHPLREGLGRQLDNLFELVHRAGHSRRHERYQ